MYQSQKEQVAMAEHVDIPRPMNQGLVKYPHNSYTAYSDFNTAWNMGQSITLNMGAKNIIFTGSRF